MRKSTDKLRLCGQLHGQIHDPENHTLLLQLAALLPLLETAYPKMNDCCCKPHLSEKYQQYYGDQDAISSTFTILELLFFQVNMPTTELDQVFDELIKVEATFEAGFQSVILQSTASTCAHEFPSEHV